jgi:ATP phosphoribosyltransferase regulatory subunit HisZ
VISADTADPSQPEGAAADHDHVGSRYPRGVRPAPLGERREERAAINKWLRACRRFGYFEIGLPALTYAEVTPGLPGVSRERVYEFDDRSRRRLALVADALPAWLNAVAQVGNVDVPEHRVAYICPVFRYHMGLGYLTTSSDPKLADLALVEAIQVLAGFAVACRIRVRVTIGTPHVWHRLYADLHRHPPRPLARMSREELREDLSLIAGTNPLAAVVAQPVRVGPGRPAEPWPSADDQSLRYRDAPVAAAVTRAIDSLAGSWRLATEIARRTSMLSVHVDPGDLHAATFHQDGVGIQFFAEDGRRLGDGGQYAGYAAALLGRPATCVSLAMGLERLADDLRPSDGCREVMVAVVARRGGQDPAAFDRLLDGAHEIARRLREHECGVVLSTVARSANAARRAATALGLSGLLVVTPWHVASSQLAYHDLRDNAGPVDLPSDRAVEIAAVAAKQK